MTDGTSKWLMMVGPPSLSPYRLEGSSHRLIKPLVWLLVSSLAENPGNSLSILKGPPCLDTQHREGMS